jgi:hypothetical protein
MEDQIRKMTDEQILRILSVEAEQYQPEALAIAEDEAKRRGLDLSKRLTEAGGEPVRFTEALKTAFEAGAKAAKSAPGNYVAAGKLVVCSHWAPTSSKKSQPFSIRAREPF